MLEMSEAALEQGRYFFYVRIPEDIGPIVRGERYEDPLDEALHAAELGEVTGGGSQMGEGTSVEYCGIDVVVADRDGGLALIRSTMRKLGCPRGSVVEEYLPKYAEHAVWTAAT